MSSDGEGVLAREKTFKWGGGGDRIKQPGGDSREKKKTKIS